MSERSLAARGLNFSFSMLVSCLEPLRGGGDKDTISSTFANGSGMGGR